jgi:transposase
MNRLQAGVVTIGVDPHPKTHTAAALDDNGKVLESLTVSNSKRGLHKLKCWSQGFQKRRWAIEGIGNHYIYPFVESLLEQGEQVYAISANLTSQYRTRGNQMKNDEVDAANAARALVANPSLSPYCPSACQRRAQQLTRHYQRLRGQLKANEMALKEVADQQLRGAMQAAIKQLSRV